MSIEEVWGGFFRPEAKSGGQKLFGQGKVSLSAGSDESIQAFIKVSPPARVRLLSESIEARSFSAECSCPLGKKGRFCKHIWATLLAAQEKQPDFLSCKAQIEKAETAAEVTKPAAETERQTASRERFEASQAAAKERASVYRKVQYQKQKLRAKELKQKRSGQEPITQASSLPPEVEAALAYFELNGFPVPVGSPEEALSEAKKKLSRVFHPDRGGSHDEVVELNRNYELVLRFLRHEPRSRFS